MQQAQYHSNHSVVSLIYSFLKGINPMFTKMARDRNDGDLLFAKADASGDVGKALGKQLGKKKLMFVV